MKTAFDGEFILIPNEYMTKFNNTTFGNCDNVSEHPLDRVVLEIKKYIRLEPTVVPTSYRVSQVERRVPTVPHRGIDRRQADRQYRD